MILIFVCERSVGNRSNFPFPLLCFGYNFLKDLEILVMLGMNLIVLKKKIKLIE